MVYLGERRLIVCRCLDALSGEFDWGIAWHGGGGRGTNEEERSCEGVLLGMLHMSLSKVFRSGRTDKTQNKDKTLVGGISL